MADMATTVDTRMTTNPIWKGKEPPDKGSEQVWLDSLRVPTVSEGGRAEVEAEGETERLRGRDRECERGRQSREGGKRERDGHRLKEA